MTTLGLVYRFRSAERLLGTFEELARQEFFLSAPDQLNDPMENYQDVFWCGDSVLWENLLRHYLLTLMWNTSGCAIMDEASFSEPRIPSTLTEDDLPTDAFRHLYHETCRRFFSDDAVQKIPDHLAALKRPIRRNGLTFVLSTVHLLALSSVVSVMQEAGLLSAGWSSIQVQGLADNLDKLFGALRSSSDAAIDEVEILGFTANSLRDQQAIRFALDGTGDPLSLTDRKKFYLIFSYPSLYTNGICESLIHPRWYTACFSADCVDASMWASYGDQHRGAALMFRVDHKPDGAPFLPVIGVTSAAMSRDDAAPTYHQGPIEARLHSVTYSDKAPEIDFFQFLGMLPRPKLMKAWHSDRDGKRSSTVLKILEDEATWRSDLWGSFSAMATTKLKDWEHEREYRIVFPDSLGFFEQNRKVRYDLSQLVGVVFGMRMALADKLKVIRIIRDKCKALDQEHFEFHEIRYHPTDGRLVRI